jgi:hypothetical protein
MVSRNERLQYITSDQPRCAGGGTWTWFSNVTDQVNGWGLRYRPCLYELPSAIGSYPAGTVLLAGNSIPADLSKMQIDLYASADKGKTWSFVSHIAAGGKAEPNNGLTPIWEPFLLAHNGQLIVYYSDQRDSAHEQKTVDQVSSDLRSWGPVVTDVAYCTYADRSGMSTVAALSNGLFVMTYEFYGAAEGGFAVYVRLATDPLDFAASAGHPVKTGAGLVPTSGPYVVWTPAGGANGTVIVSANSDSAVFTNAALATPGVPWNRVSTPAPASYSRHLRVMPNSKDILIIGGGVLSGTTNKVTVAVMDITV